MEALRVRVYNARFGDAVLISVPDRAENGHTEMRHILIDVGSVLGSPEEKSTVFRPIIEDVLSLLGGHPLDLYVMTHEHLDHVQGLLYASKKLGLKLTIDYAWLTASAAADYYKKHPKAKKQIDEVKKIHRDITYYLKQNTGLQTPSRTSRLSLAFPKKLSKSSFMSSLSDQRLRSGRHLNTAIFKSLLIDFFIHFFNV